MWNIKKIISKGEYNYALVPEHPYATKNGYVLLHRIVVENHLGRVLNTNEVVHHKDHNKKNNVIENLEILDRKEHNKLHGQEKGRLVVKLKCPWCKNVFEKYKNQTHLQKPSKYRCTCCCNKCRGKLYRYIQLHGITSTLESAISENVLAKYTRYIDEDNSEETNL
ncbi:MAG: HNH endonuclease [Butyrivibrio sp.]|nr:HNH endonuclease [Butyrivibrio sp.]MBQ7431622.1 HNH endonuclease [Butyrivibrio sp.]